MKKSPFRGREFLLKKKEENSGLELSEEDEVNSLMEDEFLFCVFIFIVIIGCDFANY